jgi:NAD(P)-dependent dehydrogenase (short-subunit alcohol dehydrogenase family)
MASEFVGNLFDLSGRKALVTGASSGLGRAFAMALARAGADVAVCARRVDRLADLADEIGSHGRKAVAVDMDVTRRASVCAALDAAAAAIGTIDVVVNNAGVSSTKAPLEYSDEDWETIVGTNLRGAWTVAQEAARRMVSARAAGSIINITSILAGRVAGGVSQYAASKAGLSHLTRALALELARYGIHVNSLAPGYIATELNRDFLASEAGERLKSRIPMRRFGDFANLDGALLLLASSAGAYITGAEIVVDGGHTCSSL